jgi:hypothetical protein
MPKYRSFVALMVGIVITAIVGTLGTSAALAQVPPPDPALPSALPTGVGSGNPTAMVSHPGSPIWVFVLVAALTMLVTAVVTFVATGRRRLSEQLI